MQLLSDSHEKNMSKIVYKGRRWTLDMNPSLFLDMYLDFDQLQGGTDINIFLFEYILPSFFGRPIPSIPAPGGLPPTRSSRPYTTFELEQIRQHARKWVNRFNRIST